MKNAIEGVSAQTLKRIPTYLTYLEEQKALGKEYISTPIIANAMGLSEILVKKDLTSILTTSGKPKVGHNIQNVIDEIKYFLGVHNETKAILVGAGQLGSALLGYKGFDKWNIKIEAAFDKNEKSSSKKTGNIAIMNVNKLRDYLLNNDIQIGIIATPVEAAQAICNIFVDCGIKGIWNFAPLVLQTPDDVVVQNENLASSLAILSKRLQSK